MEDQIAQSEVAQAGPPHASAFTSQVKQKNNGSKWLIIFIALLILGGAGIFFFTKSANEAIPTPTPSFGVVPIDNNDIPTPAPTKSPEPVSKEDVSIEIQNGTGITGEAKLLQDKLKALGYSDITAGNASSTDNTDTTVTFTKILSQTVQDEIKKMLEDTYKAVNVKTVTSQKADVVIITGLRSSQTAKPASTTVASTGTPKASGSATPKASTSPTPTATATN